MIDFGIKKQTVNTRSVLVRDHSIPITVKKIYTDVDGVIIAKNAIPANIQVKVPVFLLGEFDRMGGYRLGIQAMGPDLNLKYLMTFVNGNGAGIHNVVGFNGLADIGNEINVGDIVTVWTDSLIAPSVFIWIIVQNSYASIASIIGNSESTQNDRRIGPVFVHEIHYQAEDDSQLSEAIFILHYSNIGTWNQNSIDPLGMYRTPFDVQTGLVRINNFKPFALDQFFGLAVNLLFDQDVLHTELKIKTY